MLEYLSTAKVSTLIQNQQPNKNSKLARNNNVVSNWKTGFHGCLLAFCCFVNLPNSMTAKTAFTESSAIITSFLADSIPPAYYYENMEQFTSKGAERTAADFQNYYLQVVAARNYAAINDELTFYKTFIDTYLGERPDNTPYKIFIGPFPTRADARIFKRNNPDLVPTDAYPCPSHAVEPIITKRFLRD